LIILIIGGSLSVPSFESRLKRVDALKLK